MQFSQTDPAFVKVSENNETQDILNDLVVTPVEIAPGDVLNIGGKSFTVRKIYKENGGYAIKNSDLKKNIKGFKELQRLGVIEQYKVDDLCLVNNYNGDVLVEITVPNGLYAEKRAYSTLTDTNPRSFFVRIDSSMLNNILKDKNTQFEEIEIKLTPCMFASDSAIAYCENGDQISITERNTDFSSPITCLETNPRFTLYEREIVSRLVAAVNLLAYSKKIDQITTALPRGAYYSFLFDAAAAGLVSPEMVLDWFDRVDTRVRHLRLLIKKGIRQFHPDMPIYHYSFMDSACGIMRKYFEARKADGKSCNIEELLKLVIDTIIAEDNFARVLFQDLKVERPQTFLDLINFTYAVGNLTDMAEASSESSPPKQIIGVYDVSETMMWTATKKIRNRLILEPRGQFNVNVPQNSTYDHLSFISVMPIEHVIFDISEEFAEKYMGGFTRLYSVRASGIDDHFEENILKSSLGEVDKGQ